MKLLTMSILAILISMGSGSEGIETIEPSVDWFGFAQITAEGEDGVAFGADRVRIGFRGRHGRTFSKLQVDFNRSDISRMTAGMPEIIKDIEVGYTVHPFATLKAGMFKTPVGMDFNTSGTKLDITKRGMEKSLVLERSLGLMMSGRKIGRGFGYDVGFFNPATRSAAVDSGTAGSEYSYAFRGTYDMGRTVHVEASYGVSKAAGGAGTEDYSTWDAGASCKSRHITLKGEYISGKNVAGTEGDEQRVWFVHGGYEIWPGLEPIVRYYQGIVRPGDRGLSNMFLGLNVFLNPSQKHSARIQLNYVISGGDGTDWDGLGGYQDDVFLAQLQFAF